MQQWPKSCLGRGKLSKWQGKVTTAQCLRCGAREQYSPSCSLDVTWTGTMTQVGRGAVVHTSPCFSCVGNLFVCNCKRCVVYVCMDAFTHVICLHGLYTVYTVCALNECMCTTESAC